MNCALTSASHTRTPNDLTSTIAIAADLLNHKGSLSYCDETLATASSAGGGRRSRLAFSAFTCATNFCSAETYDLLGSVYSLHEVDVKVEHDVLSFHLSLLLSLTLLTTEHLFKLIENISKGGATSPLRPSELLREALEASKSLTTCKWIATAKGPLPSERILSLLITSHASLIVNTPLIIIT